MPKFEKTPWTVTVHDLVHRAGEMREHQLAVVLPEAMGEGLVSVPAGATLDVDLRLEGLHDGILVSAQVSGTAVGVCSRCLRDVEEPVEVDLAELFAYSADEAFDQQVRDDHVDLEPVVRDAVVLSLPFQPVCRPDCPGLDPETGERLDDVTDGQPRVQLDPRWSVLEGFRAATDSGAATASPDTAVPAGDDDPGLREETEREKR